MFVRMYVLAVLPQTCQGRHSTAGRFLAVMSTIFVYLSHLSWVARISGPDSSGRFELKNISLMVQPHCQISWQSFVRFARGSLKPEAELLATLWALPQGIFFKWKGDVTQKGPQTVALENLWLAQILWLLMDLTKKFLTDQWWFGLSPQFLPPVLSRQLKIFDISVEVFMQQYLKESISFWIWLPVPQEVFPGFVVWPQPTTNYHADTHSPTSRIRELKA